MSVTAPPTLACDGCSSAGNYLDPVRGQSFCAACSVANHTASDTRLIQLTIPRNLVQRFATVAAGVIETAAEQLIDGRGDDVLWRELNVIRINAFHALAKHAALAAREPGDAQIRAGWWVLARVLAEARDHERDQGSTTDAGRFGRLEKQARTLGERPTNERQVGI